MLYGTARKITAGPGDEQFSAEHSPQGFQVFDPLRHRNEVSLGPAPSCGPQRGALGHKRLPEPHAQRHCCPAPSEAGASGEGGNCAKKPPKRCLAVGSSTALWHRAPPCPCHQHGPCPRTRPAPGGEGAKAAILDSPQAFPRVAAAALPISAFDIMALSGNINNSTTARHHTICKERPRPALPLSNPLLPAPRSCLAAVQLLRCLQKRVLRELHAQLMRNPGTLLAEDEKS